MPEFLNCILVHFVTQLEIEVTDLRIHDVFLHVDLIFT